MSSSLLFVLSFSFVGMMGEIGLDQPLRAAVALTPTVAVSSPVTVTVTARPFPALLAEIPLAPPEVYLTGLLLDTAARRLYVTDSTGQLHIIDTTNYTELATLPAGGQLTLDASRQRLLVSPRDGSRPLAIVDTAALTITTIISPGGGVALDEGRQRLYVGQSSLLTTSLQVYDLARLAQVGQIDQPGWPIYNPQRDELYLTHLNVFIADPQTLTVTGKLLPTLMSETYGFCHECTVPSDVHLSPRDNLLMVDMHTISVGKGPGLLPSPLFFKADTLEPVANPPVELESGCFGQLLLVEPVAGHFFREQFYSRYLFAANLQVYDLAGQLVTWYDGIYLGRTNPRTRQMYLDSQVYDLLPLSPLGRLPVPACIDTQEPDTGQLYGVRDNTLVIFSENGGAPLSSPPQAVTTIPTDFLIWDIFFSPNYKEDQTVFLTGKALYRSQDGGQSWVQLQDGLPVEAAFHLAISSNFATDRMLWVWPQLETGLGAGIYRSNDGGDTWRPFWSGLNHLRVTGLELSPDFAQDKTLWANSRYMALPDTDEAFSTFMSTNEGLSWNLVATGMAQIGWASPSWSIPAPARFRWREQQEIDNKQTTIERSLDQGQTWTTVLTLPSQPFRFTSDISIKVSPNLATDGLVLVAADPYLFSSTDLGVTWSQVISSTGLKPIIFAPTFSQEGLVYAYSKTEIWRSTDRGQGWEMVLSLAQASDNISSLVSSPDGRAVYAIGAATIWRSVDGGQQWTKVFSREDTDKRTFIEAMFFSPAYLTDQTVYLLTTYDLFRSTDAGASWTKVLSLTAPDSLAAYRHPLFSPTFSTDQTMYLFRRASLFRSTDGGQTWQKWVDERLPSQGAFYFLEEVVISPALANGRHQLFIGINQTQTPSLHHLWVLDPASMNWRQIP